MKERRMQIVYRALSAALSVAALLGAGGIVCAVFLSWDAVLSAERIAYYTVFMAAVVAFVLLPLHLLVHEGGHLLLGLCCGMRFVYVQVGRLLISRRKISFLLRTDAAGEARFYPVGTHKSLRRRVIATALGGAAANLLYFVLLLVLLCVLPLSPALVFFALFAPFSLAEGVLALIPARLDAGQTDGMQVGSLVKGEPAAEVMLRVLAAQGMLRRGDLACIPRELLFDVPVTREDEPAFLSLLQLRWQYLYAAGERDEALGTLGRLGELSGYLPREYAADVACDLLFAFSVASPDREVAEGLLPEIEGASCAAACHRARAAYFAAFGTGDSEGEIAVAKRALHRERMHGVAAFEEQLLEEIKNLPQGATE